MEISEGSQMSISCVFPEVLKIVNDALENRPTGVLTKLKQNVQKQEDTKMTTNGEGDGGMYKYIFT